MKSESMTARIAAALLITATAASLLSTGFLNPILNSSGYLGTIFANQDRVIAGAFFQLVAAFASAGIAISLYPVLRRHAEGLALGSVCFRVIEGVLYIVSAVAVLLLVTLSQEFTRAGTPAPPYFQASGALLRALRDRASLTGVLAFYLGALMYYYIFFRSRLIAVAVRLGIRRDGAGPRLGHARSLPRHRFHVGAPGCLERSDRRERTGLGGMADSQGIQFICSCSRAYRAGDKAE